MSDDPYARKTRVAATGGMAIGEQKVVGNVVITRTDRPYVHDLCDAYNEAMSQDLIDRGLLWIVSHGNLRMVIDDKWSVMNTKRLKEAAERDRTR